LPSTILLPLLLSDLWAFSRGGASLPAATEVAVVSACLYAAVDDRHDEVALLRSVRQVNERPGTWVHVSCGAVASAAGVTWLAALPRVDELEVRFTGVDLRSTR
jgi:hypothetical protein